jgi:hypothetical protein
VVLVPDTHWQEYVCEGDVKIVSEREGHVRSPHDRQATLSENDGRRGRGKEQRGRGRHEL